MSGVAKGGTVEIAGILIEGNLPSSIEETIDHNAAPPPINGRTTDTKTMPTISTKKALIKQPILRPTLAVSVPVT
jgi:hypothetical protein